MKKSALFLLSLLSFSLSGIAAQSGTTTPGSVEISFSFTRQRGSASNQFAVWIEDSGGRVVKTLYAARFTAEGGWERRPQSIPLWVKQADLPRMDRKEINALTGPTPGSGVLRYTWDGTGRDGAALSPGTYRVYLEATLRQENRVLYSAPVQLGGGPAEIQAVAQYFGTGTAERGMIGPVTIRVR
jgi:hypothetical protein